MRRRYRSQAGILHDVLEVLLREGPLNATRIAQLANLPYDRLRALLEKLVEKGLVEVLEDEEGRRVYRVTQKGLEAYHRLHAAKEILEKLGYRF